MKFLVGQEKKIKLACVRGKLELSVSFREWTIVKQIFWKQDLVVVENAIRI